MGRAAKTLLSVVVGYAIVNALASASANLEAAALSGDDECLAGEDVCALSALQRRSGQVHRQSGIGAAVAAGAGGGSGGGGGAGGTAAEGDSEGNGQADQQSLTRAPNDDHHLQLLDRADYSADAASFLSEALQRQDQPGAMSGLEVGADTSMCDLAPMSYAQVLARWGDFSKEWMAKLPNDTPPGIRRQFLYRVREAFPEVLYQGNPVIIRGAIKDIGWQPDEWTKEALLEKFGDLKLQEFGFSYPQWLGSSLEVGLGADPDGGPRKASLAEYLDQNRSTQDMFIFMNEENEQQEPRMPLEAENTAVRRLRSSFAPTPPFAYPAKARLAIVAIDGVGSSHGLHEHTAVWQVQVKGHKMWHFMPPSTPMTLGQRTRGGSPLVHGQPFEHPNGCAFLKKVAPPAGSTRCLAGPGDMIIMPANWVHSTCGLSEFTAAAGGWLHGDEWIRDGQPLAYLGTSLARVRELVAKGSERGPPWPSDEDDERLAGLSLDALRLDRAAHPFDFDPAVGVVDPAAGPEAAADEATPFVGGGSAMDIVAGPDRG